MNHSNQDYSSFVKKTLIVFVIFVLGFLLLLLIHNTISILLILFASILFGVFLLGLSRLLSSKIKLSRKFSLWIVIGLLTLLFGGLYYFIGVRVADQAPHLIKSIEGSVKELKSSLSNSAFGNRVLDELPGTESILSFKNKGVVKKLFSFLSSTFGIIADLIIFIALSLFIATDPDLYVRGTKLLFPPDTRPKVEEILTKLSRTLFRWLSGRLIDMAILGLCTGIGLAILGIPLALSLAVLTSLLCFIPNIGPFLSLIPPVLIAFTIGVDKVLYVILLYQGIQLLESYLLTPFIQKKAVEVPPVVLLVGQVILASIAGGLGLLLATPILACIMVLVNELYIKGILEKEESLKK